MRIDPHPDGWREPGNLMDQSDARCASARVGAVPGLNQQMFRIVWLRNPSRHQRFGDALEAMNTAEVYESWPPFGLANRVSPLSSCCEAKGLHGSIEAERPNGTAVGRRNTRQALRTVASNQVSSATHCSSKIELATPGLGSWRNSAAPT